MLKKISLLALLVTTVTLSVMAQQKTTVLDPVHKPEQTAETPDWFKVFYGDETKIDLNDLDVKAEDYATAYKYKNRFKPTEEQKDKYIRFYRRWRRESKFFEQNGFIKFDTPEEASLKAVADKNRFAANGNLGRKPKAVAYSAKWQPIGPFEVYEPGSTTQRKNYGVNVYNMAMAPSNHDILYANGETGGLFKTTDKGLNWQLISTNRVFGGGFSCIAVHPFNPDSVYVVNANRLLLSTDGGLNFKVLVASGFQAEKLLINPNTPSKMISARNGSIYTSLNAGATWFKKQDLNGWATDVEYNPKNSNTVYAAGQNAARTGHSFFVSYDAGQTWAEKASKASGFSVDSLGNGGALIAISEADTNRIYFCYLGKYYTILNISKDGGNTWTYKASTGTGLGGAGGVSFGVSNGQGWYDFICEASPTNADELIIGTCTVFKTYNGGVSFKSFGGYGNESGQNFQIHPDQQYMISSGNDSWMATDGGIIYSSDFFTTSANSQPRQKGIIGTDFWGFDVGWNEDMVVGGTYHNGNNVASATEYEGKSPRLGGGESGTGFMFPGKRRHAAFDDLGDGIILPEKISDNFAGRFTMSKYPHTDGYGSTAGTFGTHPIFYNTFYTAGCGVDLGNNVKYTDSVFWKSTDAGKTYTMLYRFDARPRKFAISRANPNYIYLAKDKGATSSLTKTTNGGTVWTPVTLPSTNANIGGGSLLLTLHPTDENKLWIIDRNNTNGATDAAGKIFYTTNGGTSWQNITPATELANRSISDVTNDGGNGVYIISSTGPQDGTGVVVLYSPSGVGGDWIDMTGTLPKDIGTLRMRPFFMNGKLRIGGNRGAWETDLYKRCIQPVAQPMMDNNTIECFRDSIQLESYSIVNQNAVKWEWSTSPTTAAFSNPNARNPKVAFSALGNYDITLKVTDSLGQTHSKTIANAVSVVANNCGTVETLPGNMMTSANNTQYAEQKRAMNFGPTKNMTAMAWVKRQGTQYDYAGILFWRGGGVTTATGLNVRSDGTLAFHWKDMGASWGFASGLTLPDNKWAHVAMSSDADGVTLYVDGKPARATIANLPEQNFEVPMTIGRDNANSNRTFIGQIDEVALYNRTLTAEEIQLHMHLTKNNPTPGCIPTADASLLAYYQFNEDSTGTAVYDKVGANSMVLYGAKLTKSNAPIGGGRADLVSITGAGNYKFPSSGGEVTYGSPATYPNGNVVISKIQNEPDLVPSGKVFIPNFPKSYYLLRSFGNASFNTPAMVRFNDVYGTTDSLKQFPALAKLVRRNANEFASNWLQADAGADTVSNNANIGSVSFTSGLNFSRSSQFLIIADRPTLVPNGVQFIANKLSSGKVGLQIIAENNINIGQLVIEKSANAVDYTSIGLINTVKTINSFEDYNLTAGKYYYRVKIVYKDGSVKYSEIREIVVAANAQIFDVTLLPNPTKSGNVALKLDGISSNKNVTVQVFTITGKLVKTYTLTGVSNAAIKTINVANQSGTYILKIALNSGETTTKQVIVAL